MIDLEYAKEQFEIFSKKYDLENQKIRLKIDHMLRVMNLCVKFAKEQRLDEENIELAGVIGLLHDIGRFVQVEKYNTFIDSKSINHSEAGVELLFNQNYITNFVKDEKYYNIINKAIANHGKGKIEEGLDELTLMHCKIIRDADKTDIYEVMLVDDLDSFFVKEYIANASINENVLHDFYNHTLVKNEKLQTSIDEYVRSVAFIYDYNFKESLNYVLEKDYISKIADRFISVYGVQNKEAIAQIYEVRDHANNYLKNII